MKEPENIYLLYPSHASARFTASYRPTPGLKNNHYTAPNFVTPQASNTLPLPGATEHNPPMAYNTVGSLASFNPWKQFGREGVRAVSGSSRYLLVRGHPIERPSLNQIEREINGQTNAMAKSKEVRSYPHAIAQLHHNCLCSNSPRQLRQ